MRTGSKDNEALLGKLSVVAYEPRNIKQVLAEYSLASMSNRICALEEALQIETSENHPLLSPELLAIKQGVRINLFDPDEHDEQGEIPKAGTLAISEETGTRFLGASAVEVWIIYIICWDAYSSTLQGYVSSGEITEDARTLCLRACRMFSKTSLMNAAMS